MPRTHGQADNGAQITSASNANPSREQGGQVGSGRDAVGGDVGAELGEGEGCGDDEDAEARGSGDVGFFEEHGEEGEGRPDGFVEVEDDLGVCLVSMF